MAIRHLPGQGTGIRNLGPGIEYSLLSAVFDHAPHGIAYIDPNLIIRAANGAFGRQVRRPLSEVLGCAAATVIPGWSDQVESVYRQVRGTGEVISFGSRPQQGSAGRVCIVCPVYEPDREFGGYLLAHSEVA